MAVGDVDGSPVLTNGVLFVGTNAGTVHALDPVTGAPLSSTDLGDGPVKGYLWPVYGSNPSIFYVATTSKVTRLFHAGSFGVLWSAAIPGASIPFYDSEGDSLYVGSSDGKLHRLGNLAGPSPTDLTWTLGTGSAAVSSPSLDASGMLNVGTDDGTVYSVVIP